MRLRLFKQSLLFLAVLLLIPSPERVFALQAKQLNTFSQNDILFYDPTSGCQIDGTFTSKPSGDQITWIGDSYSVGAKSKIEAKLPGVDLDGNISPSNIQVSKRFGYDITGDSASINYTNHNLQSDNPSGLTILKSLADANKLRKYVVLALGTNDLNIDTQPLVDEMINIGGEDHTYVLTTPRTYEYTYASVINGFKEASKKHSNIIIADWASAVEEKLGEYFSPNIDTIHPNSDGYDLFVNTIYDALPGGSVGILAGKTNAEKAWNYFATAGISGVSDNGAAIAGILGNFHQESGINPFTHTSGSAYYGIYQTNASEMLDKIHSAGLSQYWGSDSAPDDAINQAMKIELDYLTQNNTRFTTDGYSFLKNLNNVAGTPESYADLFLVAVEGAVTSNHISPYTNTSNYIEDAGARNVGTRYFGGNDGGGEYYQEATERRNYARKFFEQFSGASSQNIINSQSNSEGFIWQDGWLTGGMPGLIKEDVSSNSDLNETIKAKYGTSDGKPNKIVLHSTEGTGNGYNAYPSGNKYPAHFIIDLRKKEAYQNLPITNRALATVSSDDSSIQIEIVGYSSPNYHPDNNYYLQNYTANDWDYLAILLAAISQETGIPLTTSVDWNFDDKDPNAIRSKDKDNFRNNVHGIVGHMHSPPTDDHTDPGNIWSFIEEAIQRNPSASKFGNTSFNGCENQTNSNVSKTGLTYEQAKQFAINYGTNKNNSTANAIGGLWSFCGVGGGSNCVSFSAFFLNKFTKSNVGSTPGNGWEVVDNLKASKGVMVGSEPKVWSVFSWSNGSLGHTGVVLGYENGEWIVGHASCTRGKKGFTGPGNGTEEGGGSAFIFKSKSIIEAVWWGDNNLKFAYLDDQVDQAAISQYLISGE